MQKSRMQERLPSGKRDGMVQLALRAHEMAHRLRHFLRRHRARPFLEISAAGRLFHAARARE